MHETHITNALAPLLALRLRTPRLELRLPTDAELEELEERAGTEGIHPPETMPFAVAWTDGPRTPGWMTAYHRQIRRDWRPDDWSLELGVWCEGALAGFQAMRASDFATSRTVTTGSWLVQTVQGRGYGTEMRAAVLELAFRGLGAEVAVSGALAGSAASARVSEKLAYRVTGQGTVAPRGEPVPHTDLELRRSEWCSPIPVTIENVAAALPLFGLSSR